MSVLWPRHGCSREVCELVVYFPKILSNTLSYVSPYLCKLPQSKSVHTIDSEYPIDIVSSQLYVCHILVSKKCQLQAGTIHPRPLA